MTLFTGIIFSTFQGQLRQEAQNIVVRPDTDSEAKPQFNLDRGREFQCLQSNLLKISLEIKAAVSPFLFLAVDLPPPPLFQDAVEKNIIPQVSIHSVLSKFDGTSAQVCTGATCLGLRN